MKIEISIPLPENGGQNVLLGINGKNVVLDAGEHQTFECDSESIYLNASPVIFAADEDAVIDVSYNEVKNDGSESA